MVAFEDFLRIFCKENAVDGDAAGSFLIGQEFCPDSLKEIKARKLTTVEIFDLNWDCEQLLFMIFDSLKILRFHNFSMFIRQENF